jgi:hypothetical protein
MFKLLLMLPNRLRKSYAYTRPVNCHVYTCALAEWLPISTKMCSVLAVLSVFHVQQAQEGQPPLLVPEPCSDLHKGSHIFTVEQRLTSSWLSSMEELCPPQTMGFMNPSEDVWAKCCSCGLGLLMPVNAGMPWDAAAAAADPPGAARPSGAAALACAAPCTSAAEAFRWPAMVIMALTGT